MKLMTFHLPFLLISIIFINKIPFNASCISRCFSIAFANFVSHNKPNEHLLGCFLYYLSCNMCPMTLVLYFLHEFLTSDVIKHSLLRKHCPWCSMTPTTSNTSKNKNILPMQLYNPTYYNTYNDH